MTVSLLPEPYRRALQALKDQAAAATLPLQVPADPATISASKAKLADAQRRMAAHDTEMRHIVRLVLKAKPPVSIPDLSESRLAEMLGLATPAH
ncbi:hypothetical protein [Cupriavidus pampae]|jgi:hypothetical protein|uniref:Uncharacterized protein n=1 Tax=Cupriavidus pampae TaxID=659251 RepID=A0ABM8XUS9_9BURK|nr:hypothetical protein [Cupriavidus pampae]CAG9184130.1 hypothetical protein LMG32289_05522 [Cupriavidus pampae]